MEIKFNENMVNPDLESPIEKLFASKIEPLLLHDIELQHQVNIKTLCGTFRLDFMIVINQSQVIAIECDGENYHDSWRDQWRDTLILATKKINQIYRIRGTDIYKHRYDYLYSLFRFHPEIFTAESASIIEHGANMRLPDLALLPEVPHCESIDYSKVYYSSDEDEYDRVVSESYDSYQLVVRHGVNKYGIEPFGKELYQYAKENSHLPLDEIIEKYDRLMDENHESEIIPF